ncbi:MAG: GreA/GreB family elongation factor [Deltaproteobacteria bacterium]|nr:GreA/GreB family elongation factor [Deltaproteobacteria bacterium]
MVTPNPLATDGPRLSTTAAGRARFVARVERARAAYDAVVASNGDAAEAGDSSVWHDNFAYEENQRQMHQLARRIHDLQDALRRLEVVSAPPHPERVGLGSAVTLEDADGRVERVVVGGYEDGDPALRRVAYTAPLAQALIGAEPGDTLSVRLGGRARELTVLSVEAARPEEL